MKYRTMLFIATVIVAIVIAGVGTYELGKYGAVKQVPGEQIPEGTVCTMEAKLCPDGSYVGRSGPQCEFAECPTAALSPLSVFGDSVIAYFEGTDRLAFTFKYSSSSVSVSAATSSNKKVITVRDTATKQTATVFFTFEGGRGYTPSDYFDNELSKTCKDCVRTQTDFGSASLGDARAYMTGLGTSSKIYLIAASPKGSWLTIMTYPQNNKNIIDVLQTFSVVSETHSTGSPEAIKPY